MKALKYLLLLILVLIIGGSIYIATLNGNYDVKRSRTMKIPAEVIYNNVNDYKNWQHWGPWYEMDSTIVASYPAKTSGVDASYTWTGKDGAGSMKTLSLIPNKQLIQELQFSQGSPSEITWNIEYTNTGNKVTWGMKGENSFSEKAFWLTQGGIEKNMAPMFSRGLELLEKHLLKEMDKHSFEFVGEVDHGGGFYLYQTTSCKINDADKKMGEMFPAVAEYIEKNKIDTSGKPFLLTHNWDEQNKTTMFSTCVPVKERIETEGNVLTGYLLPQKTFKTVYKGSYTNSYKAWEAAYKELAKKGFKEVEKGEPFEVYKIRPTDNSNPAEWITEIYIPIE
ncbi:effector-binding domain-containing protein [Lutibacter oricola]|uniref:Effector-binding domain-containing protein n=1 Tax=Lutibacter oricola TaxID=762486 RepID=A0A1H2U186_9FLAO|nr:GyrI-like domain-containing protein [Lutibacter oricola]SDW49738.1 effector-binding domain-containing protein [Lutibacter oricola]